MPDLGLRALRENWDIRDAAYHALLEGSLHRRVIRERMAQHGTRLSLNNLTRHMGRDARLRSFGKGVWGIREEAT